MAHKSHRQKALQSQLEERPAISLVDDEKTKKKSKKTKSTSSASSAAPASALASSTGMEVDGDEALTQAQPSSMHVEDDDGDVLIDNATASTSAAPAQATSSGFAPLPVAAQSRVLKNEFRRIPIPSHRITPLKRDWVNLYTPMVEHLGLQVRMNMQRRAVELKVSLAA
jgi:RNA-binding protein PNO1